MTRAFVAMALMAWVLMSASSALCDGELARARVARDNFFTSPDISQRSAWQKLITQFEDAARAQVRDVYRAQAQLEAAELALQCFYKFKDKRDATKAETLTRKILKDCSRCPNAPKAVIILGMALVALERMDDAYRELMKVELNYPDAPEINEARGLMSMLRAGGTPPPYPSPQQTIIDRQGQAPAATSDRQGQTPAATAPTSPATFSITSEPPKAAPAARSDGLAQVYALSLEDHGDYSTVIAWTDKVTSYVYNLIPAQRNGGTPRVYVDFRDAKLASGMVTTLNKTTPLIKLVKVNQFNDNTVRLVMDFPEVYPYTPVFLDNPPRLVVQVAKSTDTLPQIQIPDAPPGPTDPAPREVQAQASPPPARGPADSMARQLGLKIRRIVIDPGHGGKDNGATGHGIKEKELALKTSKLLKTKIENRLGLEVILTRDSDKFVTLDRRPKIVRDNQGDLFISIHANANTLASVEGLETYILNFTSDPSAQTVAARENASSDKSMSEMEDILEQIARNTKVSESRVLAKTIHSATLKSIRTKYKVRDLGVKEAVFVVLVNVEVPAILMEIGFLTNKAEAARLSEDQYLELVTDGIVNGLESYLKGLARQ
ncbi:MAG: N-acetylmuramoyl-L-alanine amidase [Deltaproteobacteria bacterium]|jgi:N-acetylmuramoyl-L-alanine amidase|nr:N-acetylmuramoyl-L-alanine amidase [Deltaproteobacteria bacterium]